MKAVSVKPLYERRDGTRVVDAFIIANETPAALPTTGENIAGLRNTDTFAPFSMIFIVGNADTKLYIANEDGAFVGQ